MEVRKTVRKVRLWHIAAAVLFLVVWIAEGRLTGGPVPKRCFVYAVLLPFLLPAFQSGRRPDLPARVASAVLALFFALCCSCGYSLYKWCDFTMCWGSLSLFVVWVLKTGVYWCVCHTILLWLFSRLQGSASAAMPVKWAVSNRTLFLLFFCCRIPYLVAYYPCLFDYDGAVSISSFGEGRVLYDHHPFLVTCVQKLFFDIGSCLGSASAGMAMLSLLSMAFTSLILVYMVRVCARMGAGVGVQKALVAVYALFPLFPLVSIYDTKDGFFTYILLLFVLSLLHLMLAMRREGQLPKRILLLHGVAALLMCLTRHQGIYFVVAQYLCCLCTCRQTWRAWTALYLPVVGAYLLVARALFPALEVAPSSKHEMLGHLFQQSALCFIQHPDQMTPQERDAFEGVLEINVDTLSLRAYDYHVTDPIKGHYRFKPVEQWSVRNHFAPDDERQAVGTYLASWTGTCVRHPATCALASLNIVNGFFYNTGGLFGIESWHDCPYLLPEYRFYRCDAPYSVTNRLFDQLSRLPVLEFLFAKAYYTWLFLFALAVLLIRRDTDALTVFLSFFLSVALFMVSPTATYRYSLPLVTGAAVIIIYLTHQVYAGKQK